MQSTTNWWVIKGLVLTSFLGTNAQAWDFTPGLPCVLTHETSTAEIELTFDPTVPLYSITVTRDAPWPQSATFAMRFEGSNSLSISTNRQQFNADRRALTVTDRGFGNVLDGLQYNDQAIASLGDVEVAFPLEDAADAVAAFRQCRGDANV
ncbi:MAG: hypothetical protein AB8B62_10410 [Roseobacter sp.]